MSVRLVALAARTGLKDLRILRRDPFLVTVTVIPLATALLARWGVPYALERAGDGAAAFAPLASLYVGYTILMSTPFLMGVLVGFLLLDERDEGTLHALMVTPVTLPHYLGYRVAAPVLLSVAVTLVAMPLTGLVPVSPWRLAAVAAVAALLAPTVALTVASLAQNKVQGFGIQKLLGVVGLAPFGAMFLAEPWQSLAGVLVPAYWPMRAFRDLLATGALPWAPLAVGVTLQGTLVLLLLRVFRRVSHR